MFASLVAATVLVAGGGCGPCGTQTYSQSCEEIHYIRNTGQISSRFDVWVQLSDGHQTVVPVINGYLPLITPNISNGRIDSLICDYTTDGAILWGNRSRSEWIVYEIMATQAVERKAPAPQHPERRRGVGGEAAPVKTESIKKVDAPKFKEEMLQPSKVGDIGVEVRPRYK